MRVVDMTPTPMQYRRVLEYIVRNTTKVKDRRWARSELFKLDDMIERKVTW